MCRRTIEIPQELGRSCRFLGQSRLEIPGDQLQASAAHSSGEERKERVQPRYRQAKATKRGGMDGRKSQHPRSTDEAGELVPRDPVEERKNRKGVPDVGTWAANYVRGFVLGTRITVTAQDSRSGLQYLAVWRIHHQRNRML